MAFAAGFLDGEGCFSITTYGKNKPYSKISIKCSNTNKPVIEWLKKTFGGSISTSKGRKEKHRTIYSWSVVSQQAKTICQYLIPYLKVKQNQAIGLLLFQNTIGKIGQTLSFETIEERDRIEKIVRELKHETFS